MKNQELNPWIGGLILAGIVVDIAYLLWPLTSKDLISGWDLVPAFYLTSSMSDLLATGQVTGWNWGWYAGFPIFRLYGPLPFVGAALVQNLSSAILSPVESFHLFLACLALLFIAASSVPSRLLFGKGHSITGAFAGLLYLGGYHQYEGSGIGLFGSLLHGHVSAFFSGIIFLLWLGVLGKLASSSKAGQTVLYTLCSAGLISGLILSHILTTIAAAFVGLVFILLAGKGGSIRLTISCLCAALITFFWWYPFLRGLPYSSGEGVGVFVNQPLLLIFPGLEILADCVRNFDLQAVLRIPIGGVLILAGTIVGLVSLIRSKQFFLPVVWILAALLLNLPGIQNEITGPLHYYRFINSLFLISLPIVAFGITRICQMLLQLRFGGRFIIGTTYVWALATTITQHSSIAEAACGQRLYANELLAVSEYPDYADAEAMLDALGKLRPSGRVAVESTLNDVSTLGTPHYFTTFLPHRYGISVLPGLLAESSLSAPGIMAALGAYSESISWGQSRLSQDQNFLSQSLETMIDRLKLFGVEYVLASSTRFSSEIEALNLEKATRHGHFNLYRLQSTPALITTISQKPWLVVGVSPSEFRTLAEEWYADSSLFKIPLIYSDLPWNKVPLNEKASLGGIVNLGPKSDQLNVIQNEAASLSIPFHSLSNLRSFESRWHSGSADARPASNIVMEDNKISFEAHGPTIIRGSYFPNWRSLNSDQTVYWMAPSLMLVFAQGQTNLIFDGP